MTKTYEEMLDCCYNDLPEQLKSKNRFEIPKVSGKFIKTKTHIKNFIQISDLLHRNTNHLFKFFIKELGIRGEMKDREVILYSKFQVSILNKTIEKYYENFVKCPTCLSPDTILDGENFINCKACGNKNKSCGK